jgi:hypothetical protein
MKKIIPFRISKLLGHSLPALMTVLPGVLEYRSTQCCSYWANEFWCTVHAMTVALSGAHHPVPTWCTGVLEDAPQGDGHPAQGSQVAHHTVLNLRTNCVLFVHVKEIIEYRP